MPDSITPASQMIRVPTPLIDAVKELSRLHRQGHTRAVLSRLHHLIADIDSNNDSDGASVRDSDITTDSRIDSETIVGVIAAAMAPIQEKIAQIEKTTTSIETSNILATEISKLNERLGVLERCSLDLESLAEDVSTDDLPSPVAEPATNLDGTGAAIPASLSANPGAGIAKGAYEELPPKEAIAISSSDPADYLTRKDLGGLLGVSHESIRVWEQSGKLKEQGWEPVPGTGGSPNNPIRYRQISRQI